MKFETSSMLNVQFPKMLFGLLSEFGYSPMQLLMVVSLSVHMLAVKDEMEHGIANYYSPEAS